MKTYVACIGGEAVLAFRAEGDDEARAMIDVRAVGRTHHNGRKQARDSGHSPFRGPARGRYRARGSK
jgi:hypothetical protein